MFEDEIELIRNWLETRGFEIFIDDIFENIFYYDEEFNLKHFCKINKKSLNKIIDRFKMDEIDEIE